MFKMCDNRLRMRDAFYLIVLCGVLLLQCSVEAQQHICGKALDQMFSVVCKYGMPSKLQKRAAEALSHGKAPHEGFLPLLDVLNDDVSNSMLRLRRSYIKEIGAYDECCLKGCFISEMVEYCLKSPDY